jgi:EthD domain
MEKVVAVLRAADRDEGWCERLRGPVAESILASGVAGLTVSVRDSAVSHSMMTLTTFDPPAVAVVSVWTPQCYGEQIVEALRLLAAECDLLAGYLVTESTPQSAPLQLGERTTGLANVALLRRPAELDYPTWLHRWQHDHTPVAIETQSTFGYTQNAVVRALTPDAPRLAAIVEELFPIEAVSDLKAFFGAADDGDLQQRLGRMIASTSAFGANENIDTVPTSRYVLKTPFNG